MIKILIITFSVTLFSCHGTDTKQVAETYKELIEDPSIEPADSNSSKSSDTLMVGGKNIVFFSITQDEYDKIIKEEGQESGIDEVLDDFNYYASEIADSLNKAGFKTIMTASKTFAVVKDNGVKKNIARDIKKGAVGVMLFDGLNEPMIDYGVGTDIDYFSLVDEYFKKK